VADFLSADWLAARNADLAGRGPSPAAATLRVVLALTDAPAHCPRAITLVLGPEGGRIESGDPGVADVVVTLSMSDARALAEGAATSTGALRDGLLAVRGDVSALVAWTAWLAAPAP
jgi:SCP-2 sterol transfer family